MSGYLDQQKANKALDLERQLMKKALARLGPAESKRAGMQSAARLIFGLDLTASREASLNQARIATAAMFDAIKEIGKLAVKLVFYRGADECRQSKWYDDATILCRSMLKLACETGETQIARLLRMVLVETEQISAVVFIGDHSEDDGDELRTLAQMLGQRSIPLFIFHECADSDQCSLNAKPIFKSMAELSGGVYVEFRKDSSAALREMLANVAAYSTAGIEGIGRLALPETSEARQLRGRLMLGSGGVKG